MNYHWNTSIQYHYIPLHSNPIVMKSDASKSSRKQKIRYSKVIVNVPQPLITRFDRICEREGFSRQEAIKQAIREFIYDHTDKDSDPELIRDAMKNMMLGMAEGARQIPSQHQPVLMSSPDSESQRAK